MSFCSYETISSTISVSTSVRKKSSLVCPEWNTPALFIVNIHSMFVLFLQRHGSQSSHTKRRKTWPKSTDIVSYVPANALKDSVYSGFADLQFGTAPRARYWCVLHSDCLYVYQNPKSQSTVKTIVLPGYKVQAADHNVKDEFAIMLTHPGVSPVCLMVGDQSTMTLWLEVLDQGSRAESHRQYKGQKASSGAAASKKGPVKGDHTVLKLKDVSASFFPPHTYNEVHRVRVCIRVCIS